MAKTTVRTLSHRLNIIKGQVNALTGYIENEKDCKKIVAQFYAINAGLKKVMELYFQESLNSCTEDYKRSDKDKINFLLKEIIKNK